MKFWPLNNRLTMLKNWQKIHCTLCRHSLTLYFVTEKVFHDRALYLKVLPVQVFCGQDWFLQWTSSSLAEVASLVHSTDTYSPENDTGVKNIGIKTGRLGGLAYWSRNSFIGLAPYFKFDSQNTIKLVFHNDLSYILLFQLYHNY